MLSRTRFFLNLGALVAANGTLACEAVLGAPDYRVTEPGSPANVLAGRFSSGSGACTACLATGACGDEFERCAATEGCAEFATCTLEQPSPASVTECVVRLAPTDEVLAMHTRLSRCYAGCVNDCGGGRDFRCANAYRYPGAPPDPTIHVTQSFWFVQAGDKSTAGLDVSFCRPATDCADPITTVTTDEDGTYEADIPIAVAPLPEIGFRGFRLVHREEGRIFPHRLHTSRPLMVDHEERTGLADEAFMQTLFKRIGATGPLSFIFVQMFDCRGVGAEGAYFEVDSSQAFVAYLRGSEDWGAGPTLASQEGAAMILGLTPGEYHEVRAHTEDGTVVAFDKIYVPGDAVIMSTLFPKEMD